MTQNEAFALAERVTGRNIDTVNVSVEQVLGVVKHDEDVRTRHWMEYAYSMWIRGDNTVENAKKPEYGGARDAKELYPDIGKELRPLQDVVKELHSS